MADVEIRAFGWRFFAVLEKTGKVRTAAEEADLGERPVMHNHSGSFGIADPDYDNGFGFGVTHG